MSSTDPDDPSPEPPADPPHDSPNPGMGRTAVRGGIVTMIGQTAKIGVQVVSTVLLARLLSPHDYGLLAMIMSVIGVADVFRDFGLSSAAIQARTLSREQQVNLFWANSLIGIALGCAIFAGAPLLELLYDQPLLVPMTHLLAVSFVLNGMATQYRADLTRRLKFSRLTTADVAAAVIALGVAGSMALAGAGYWALVAQQLVQFGAMLVFVASFARWLPGRYRRSVSLKPFLSFGWKLAGSQLVNYAGNNVDSLTIGTRFGAAPLGLYNRSFQLLMTPLGQVRGPLNTVAIPILSQMQDDEERFSRYIVRGQLVMGYSIVAGLAVVVGGAESITRVFLGEQWLATVPILRLLAAAGIFQTLSYVGYWVYVSRGLVGELFKFSLISTAIRITAIVSCSYWGVTGVALGYAIAPAIAWQLSLWWLSRRSRIPSGRLIMNGYKLCGFAAVIAAAAFGAESWVRYLGQPAPVRLVAVVAAAAVSYVVVTLIMPSFRRDVTVVLSTARDSLRRRGRS